ncbi:MAG: DUF4124 domain-containing protein [Pseudomonadales bacterium]
MKIERLLLACMILVAGSFIAMNSAAATKIFKTVDADGNVVFSDLPPGASSNPQTVEVEEPNVYAPGAAATQLPSGVESWVVPPGEDGAAPELSQWYRSLTIASPAHDASVRANAGTFNVVAQLVPALQSGHSARLLLDNVAAGSAGTVGENVTFALTNIDRGTHTLKVEVLDGSGSVVFRSNQSTFHLLRYSTLTAPNRARPNNPG